MDVSMTDLSDNGPSQKKQENTSKGHEINSKTIKTPPFSYACLELISESNVDIKLDDITVRTYIMSALTQFLGLTGSAISVDILKVDGRECWVRVPREDLGPVVAAVGGWVGIGSNGEDGKVGWKIKASGNWLGSLVRNMDTETIWKG